MNDPYPIGRKHFNSSDVRVSRRAFMPITQLTLNDFRNYSALRIDCAEGFMVFSGENGAGKTNILEAVSLLAPGRGLRRSALKDIACESGSGGFAVAADIGTAQIGTGTLPANPERRKTRINEASVPTNDLAQWLSIIWLTPAMDRLFMDGAAGRRNFLDRMEVALNPVHARNCSRYESARRERNRLLSDLQSPDDSWLDALDAQLAEYGSAIATARRELVKNLNSALIQDDDGLFAIPTIALDDDELQDEQAFIAAMQVGRQADIAAGRTLRGPHRADMKTVHAEKQRPAEKCSTGEQKAMLFSMILAHADLVAKQRGNQPLLLLDEVAAHLDPIRRAALFDRLAIPGRQIWLTGTEPELFSEVPAQSVHFRVKEGSLSRYD